MNSFAKKDYATKKELRETKQELLDKLVSKEEFHTTIRRVDGSIEKLANQVGENTLEIKKLNGEVTGLRGEVGGLRGEIDDRFAEMNGKFDMVLTAIDGLSGQVNDMKTEKAAGERTFKRHENQLNNHETRIEKLERKVR